MLNRLGQHHRTARRGTLMNVMADLDVPADILANILESVAEPLDVFGIIAMHVGDDVAAGRPPDTAATGRSFHRRTRRTAALAALALAGQINAEMVIAVGHHLANLVVHRLGCAGLDITQHAQPAANLAAQKVVDRHAAAFSHDVPQGAVNRRHRVVRIDTAAPVRRNPQLLPDFLDLVRVAADQKWLDILLDRVGDDGRPLRMGAAADAVKARLAGIDLHIDHIGAGHLGVEHLDVGNFQGRNTAGAGAVARRRRGLRRRCRRLRERFAARCQCHGRACRAAGKCLQCLTPIHDPTPLRRTAVFRSFATTTTAAE